MTREQTITANDQLRQYFKGGRILVAHGPYDLGFKDVRFGDGEKAEEPAPPHPMFMQGPLSESCTRAIVKWVTALNSRIPHVLPTSTASQLCSS
jgi:hypothetical protein